MSTFDCPIAEYLGLQPAELTHKPSVKLGFITFRLRPLETLAATNISLTKPQMQRLRDDINCVLHDPRSWLYTSDDCWKTLKVPEGFEDHIGRFE